MFFTPHIGWNPLAQLCRRMGTSLSAGVDVRKVLQRESQTGRPLQRHQLAQVRDGVEQGDSLTESLAACGNYFPSFFREMIGIGEQTGKLDHVFPRLADYYEHLVQLRRVFLIGIAWPMLQLLMATVVIGILILALGWVASTTGETSDLLGHGLVGVPGLIKYLTGLGLLVACGLVGYRLATHGVTAHYLAQLLFRLPGLGPNLRIMSLARMAWSLGLAIDSGADARLSIRLALNSSGNPYYQRHAEQIDQSLRRGREIHETLRATGNFPQDFLDAVEIGEESGRLSESMLKLAENYRERAKATMTGVTMFVTFLVWGGVGAVLIFLIFRLFSAYLGILDDAMAPI